MSYWVRPTTADIGIRAFARNESDLFREVTLGMQNILIQDGFDTNKTIRKSARWEVQADVSYDLLLVKWLDEVLYRAEVHNQFLIDLQPMLRNGMFEAQVSFVEKDEIETEIEIKAVTSHKLAFVEVKTGEEISSPWEQIPSFSGPGWLADVVFDI